MKDPFYPEKLERIDKMNVRATYAQWPNFAREGLEVPLQLPRKDYRKVYVLGLGGSAAAGDILASWLWSHHRIEAEVCKGVIPTQDLKGALAVACSASGQTKETISMMKTALKSHATVISMSHGGRLAKDSKRLGVPHIQMPAVLAPRYILPFMVFSCFALANAAFRLDSTGEANEAIHKMERLRRAVDTDVPLPKNPAKKLALRLLRKTPAVYGTRVTRGAGVRFKNEVNENAKGHASYEEMPELLHNEIQAWTYPSRSFVPVVLRDSAESDRERHLANALTAVLSELGKKPLEVRGSGMSGFSRLATMVYELDYVSYYMAVGLGRDPFPVPLIARLKEAV